MRLQFVISEILIGLRRNLTMTIAVIVTVAISLALFGAGLLIRSQVNTMKDYWYDKVELSIFLDDNVTQDQRKQIEVDLENTPEVANSIHESKEEAYERFKEQFKDSPAIVQNVTPDALPESYRVKLKDPRKFAVVASAFVDRPGVQTVLNQRAVLDRFFKVLHGFQAAALFIALVQLLAAAVLISNTIRVAAFNRRRETGIMRLVGASNLYIQLPFLLEGALAGFVGSAVAIVALALIKALFIDARLRPAFTFTAFIGWGAVWAIVPIIILAGVGLSAMASFLTLRRYLRV